MKFKKGDKVKVVKILAGSVVDEYTEEQINSVIGSIGTVIGIDINYEYPYYIEFDNPDINQLGLDNWKEEELSPFKSCDGTYEVTCMQFENDWDTGVTKQVFTTEQFENREMAYEFYFKNRNNIENESVKIVQILEEFTR